MIISRDFFRDPQARGTPFPEASHTIPILQDLQVILMGVVHVYGSSMGMVWVPRAWEGGPKSLGVPEEIPDDCFSSSLEMVGYKINLWDLEVALFDDKDS